MLDFTKIRGDSDAGRRAFFEQLVCRLAKIDRGGGEFRRIDGSGGDGGVEAIRLLPSGKKVGYQAKYHSGKIDWAKIDNSVSTALTQHPELERYVIALPLDFTGKRVARGGSTNGAWGEWDQHVMRWEKVAAANGSLVMFEPWTAFEIEGALQKPEAQYLIPFFFANTLTFTSEWLGKRLLRTNADLGARYSPDEHVDTESLHAFDVIYRRENVCRHLRSIFDLAKLVDPQAVSSLVPSAGIPADALKKTTESLESFSSLRDAVNAALPQSWPLSQWISSWRSATRQLHDVWHQAVDNISKDDEFLRERIAQASKIHELLRPEIFGGRWARLLPIDGVRAVLFTGRAGAGKSHVLARGAQQAWKDGAPVVHLLGQHIVDDDPRVSILRNLELTAWSFNEMLAALDLAAEAAGTRALLAIDALNEGSGLNIWRNHLASFIQEVKAHEWITLVLSCREEYLPYVLPNELLANLNASLEVNGQEPGTVVHVSVDGFRSTHERELALRTFMDAKGIARPTAPVLDDEFFNPLFMSSVCRSMAKAGIAVFPRGLHGASEIFSFVLKTKVKAMGTHHDGTRAAYGAMLRALDGLAGSMVQRQADHVLLDEADAIIETAFKTLPIGNRAWLTVLEGSDILRRDILDTPGPITPLSSPCEVIRFAFQRLQDQMTAARLLRECSDIESTFGPAGPFAFLIRRSLRNGNVPFVKPVGRWVGVLGALWASVAESHGKELYDLHSFFGSPDDMIDRRDFQPVFRTSIRERKGNAFTPRTLRLLEFLWEEDAEENLEILVSTSCVPGHAWNADFLAARITSFAKAERFETWSRHFGNRHSKLTSRGLEIADWATHVDAKTADAETLRLAGLALVCFCIADNTALRESAKNGLAKIVREVPSVGRALVDFFGSAESEMQAALIAAGTAHQ